MKAKSSAPMVGWTWSLTFSAPTMPRMTPAQNADSAGWLMVGG
ncbi:Uncharacterised protein [Bordetella pertussis]|nr:Uncharacterised protein [Bordetella pertussis]CFW10581.1 Uncharacterised protein [Bordetella pertussis]